MSSFTYRWRSAPRMADTQHAPSPGTSCTFNSNVREGSTGGLAARAGGCGRDGGIVSSPDLVIAATDSKRGGVGGDESKIKSTGVAIAESRRDGRADERMGEQIFPAAAEALCFTQA